MITSYADGFATVQPWGEFLAARDQVGRAEQRGSRTGMNIFLLAIVAVAVAALLVMMWTVGNLFRRVGPNRALIVYGWGGTHIVTGGGQRRLAALSKFSGAVARADVVRRRARATAVHLAGRRGRRRGRLADQGQVGPREHPHRRRAIPDQASRRARGAAAAGHGRPPARHRRLAQGGRDRQGARDRRRPRARQRLRRPEQDGPRRRVVHHQEGHRRERLHQQHGSPGHRPGQARSRHRHRPKPNAIPPSAARWLCAKQPLLRPRPTRSA